MSKAVEIIQKFDELRQGTIAGMPWSLISKLTKPNQPLVGYLDVPYARLFQEFGQPKSGAGKNIANWYIRFGDNSEVWVYNQESDAQPERVNKGWLVAGDKKAAVRLSRMLGGTFRKMKF